MDYEKKYKEALERARQFSEHPLQEDSSNIVEYIFPELRESENERTRKEIISFLQLPHKQFVGERKQEKWIAWLEKQGEQKPGTIDIDKMVAKYSQTKDGSFGLPINCQIRAYRQGINDALNLSLNIEKQGEQKPIKMWHDVSEVPDEMQELLVEWESPDATWHDIAFYDAETKAFRHLKQPINNVTRWAYVSDILSQSVTKTSEQGWSDALERQGEQKLPIEKLPEEMKTIGESLGFTTQEECDGYNQMVSDLIMSADKVEPKFHKGDWIVTSYGKVNQVVAVDKDGDGFTLDDDTYFSGSWKDGYHLWTIQDAKDGDVLVASDSSIFIFKEVCGSSCKHYIALTSDNEIQVNTKLDKFWETARGVKPSTKEQRDTLIKAMTDSGYTFNFEKKELKKIKQKSQRMVSAEAKEALYDKPAWSEEDEDAIGMAIIALGDMYDPDDPDNTYVGYSMPFNKAVERLKSLKQRIGWKPSDEQMKALHDLNLTGNISYAGQGQVLIELYNDLKKLIE